MLNQDALAPVVLFAYCRPDHTRRTLDALSQNELAYRTDLIIYADGVRSAEDQDRVQAVRALVHGATGFRTVRVIQREANYGLARNIIEGVTEVCAERGRVIVLEDDLVTSPSFLTYMNQGLQCYANDERVASIHGYCCAVKTSLPETFFIRGADCWGWATWSRAWRMFIPDGAHLLRELRRQRLTKLFDFDGTFGCVKMLEDQVSGKNDSWAIRWTASAFLANMLTLYPARSLVQNIGFDFTGRHCGNVRIWEVPLSTTPIQVSRIGLDESAIGRTAFKRFFRHNLPQRPTFTTLARDWMRRAYARVVRELHARRGHSP